MERNKLLIIDPTQFGYQNTTYYYCKSLKEDYSIVYLCWEFKLPKIDMHGVRVVYVNRNGNFLIRGIRILRYAFWELSNRPVVVFIKYFKIISLVLKLCRPSQCFVLDIRSGSIAHQPIKRIISDAWLKLETRFFKHITVISKGLAQKLKIAHKAHILPLGADIISSKTKVFDELNLLYVGTLFNRDIGITIKGFKKYYGEFNSQIPISYTIIGGGPNNEEEALRDLVARYHLTNAVTITGLIPHNQLKVYFDLANIGVSYIPLTDYYDVQPPTKTFEYILSGMPVIATHTTENRKIINPENGILVGDTAENFNNGLKIINEKRKLFDSRKIRDSGMDFTWENIVLNNLKVYLENICH